MAIENPIWKGNTDLDVVKSNSLVAMEHHANKQINALKEQAQLLIKQAEEIRNRVNLAYQISSATYNFKPVLLKEYYLYKDDKDQLTLTLIAPNEWKSPYGEFVTVVRQLGDSTWEEIKKDGVYEECSKRDSENHGA